MYIFEISTKSRISWCPIRPIQIKKVFISYKEQWTFLRSEKGQKWKKPLKISKISNLWNFVKITGTYWTVNLRQPYQAGGCGMNDFLSRISWLSFRYRSARASDVVGAGSSPSWGGRPKVSATDCNQFHASHHSYSLWCDQYRPPVPFINASLIIKIVWCEPIMFSSVLYEM